MLVLTRKSDQWTNVKVNKDKLRQILESDSEAELRLKVYDVEVDSEGKAEFRIAFDDDNLNFNIERPERKKNPT